MSTDSTNLAQAARGDVDLMGWYIAWVLGSMAYLGHWGALFMIARIAWVVFMVWVVCYWVKSTYEWVIWTYDNWKNPTVYHYRKPYEKGDTWP